MDHAGVMKALKALYQTGPAGGGRVETCDIEDAVWWAGRVGRGFLDRHEVTWDGAEYRIVESAPRV